MRKCRTCGTRYEPTRPIQTACSIACALIQAKAARAKKEAKEDRAKKLKLKTRATWMREAQMIFNKFIRLRDQLAGHLCISSGKPLDWTGNNVDAGHFRSRGSAPHLRFNEDNCHAQSKQENRYASGNAVGYRIGLISRIGLERVEALEADQEPRKWSIEDLKSIKKMYQEKIRKLSSKLV